MLSRRGFLGCACCAGALALPAASAFAAGPGTTLTADQALARLQEGNAKFLAGTCEPVSRQSISEVAKGQKPFAVVITCADSRLSPELLFSRGVGELFVIRNAGNTIDTAALGSLQYGIAVLGAPLLVVLGHERCGAVEAAVKVVKENATFPGAIGAMIEPIIPAVIQAQSAPGDLLNNAIHENVRRTVTRLRSAPDPLVIEPLKAGKLKIVGAHYDLDDGKVNFFDL